jgi:hypothetical protein
VSPFELAFRLFRAGFRITGYLIAAFAQSLWYVAHLKPDRVGDAIGYLGRGVTDAIADVMRR